MTQILHRRSLFRKLTLFPLRSPSNYLSTLSYPSQNIHQGNGTFFHKSEGTASSVTSSPRSHSTTFFSRSSFLPYRFFNDFSLRTPCRGKSYNFYINLEDPDETYRHVVEARAKLEQEGRGNTTAYLHQELNEVLALYQGKKFIEAHAKAEELHEKALEHRKSTSLLFFTAKTASHCCVALANAYEQHLQEKEERSRGVPTALAPPTSAVFQARRTILKLREDAERYQGIASRIQQKPEMVFLRAVQEPSKKKKKEEQEASSSHETGPEGRDPQGAHAHENESEFHCHSKKKSDEETDRNWGSSGVSSSSSSQNPVWGDQRKPGKWSVCQWGETSARSGVDEEYEPFFGRHQQSNRRRPAYRERAHHLARECVNRRVPK